MTIMDSSAQSGQEAQSSLLQALLAQQQQSQQAAQQTQMATSMLNSPTPQGQVVGGGGGGAGGGARMPGMYVPPSNGQYASSALQKAMGAMMLKRNMNNQALNAQGETVGANAQDNSMLSGTNSQIAGDQQMQDLQNEASMPGGLTPEDASSMDLSGASAAGDAASASAAEDALNGAAGGGMAIQSIDPSTASMGGIADLGDDADLGDMADM
jgi:hypothetical protein